MPWANPTSPNLPDFYQFVLGEMAIEPRVLPPPTVSAAPAAAGLTAGVGGSLPAGPVYVVLTYVSAFGETTGSVEASVTVAANGSVTVASPAAVGFATGYRVYASTISQAEVLQSGSVVPIGTDFVLSAIAASNATPPTANTTGWTWPYYAFERAVALVLQVPTWMGLDYTIAVYNAAGHILIATAPDQPAQVQTGAPFFATAREGYDLNKPSSGVIQSSGDQGTSNSLAVPESLQRLNVGDLWFFRTPYGRAYLAFAQDFGEIAGLT